MTVTDSIWQLLAACVKHPFSARQFETDKGEAENTINNT